MKFTKQYKRLHGEIGKIGEITHNNECGWLLASYLRLRNKMSPKQERRERERERVTKNDCIETKTQIYQLSIVIMGTGWCAVCFVCTYLERKKHPLWMTFISRLFWNEKKIVFPVFL